MTQMTRILPQIDGNDYRGHGYWIGKGIGPSVRKLSPMFRGKKSKNGFEVHDMRPRGSRSAKICSSVAGKYMIFVRSSLLILSLFYRKMHVSSYLK